MAVEPRLSLPVSHLWWLFCLSSHVANAKDSGSYNCTRGADINGARVFRRHTSISESYGYLASRRVFFSRPQSNLFLHRLQRIDHELNMLVEFYVQLNHALMDVVAID